MVTHTGTGIVATLQVDVKSDRLEAPLPPPLPLESNRLALVEKEATAPADSQALASLQEQNEALNAFESQAPKARVSFLEEKTSDMYSANTRVGSLGGEGLASIIEEAIEDAQAFEESKLDEVSAEDDKTAESQPHANPIFAPEEEWEEFANAPLIGQA